MEHIACAMAGVDAAALAALRSLLEWDIATRWPHVPCPVETINSAALSQGIEAVPNLYGLRVHFVQGVGHFPMREDPSGLPAAISEVARRHLAYALPASR